MSRREPRLPRHRRKPNASSRCKSIDLESGEAPVGGGKAITECFRIDRHGQVLDTQYQLVSREDVYAARESRGYYGVDPNPYGYDIRQGYPGYQGYRGYQGYQGYQGQQGYYYDNNGRYVPVPREPVRPPAQYYGQSGSNGRDPRSPAPPRDPYGREYQTPQRIEPPGYIWGNRRY